MLRSGGAISAAEASPGAGRKIRRLGPVKTGFQKIGRQDSRARQNEESTNSSEVPKSNSLLLQ